MTRGGGDRQIFTEVNFCMGAILIRLKIVSPGEIKQILRRPQRGLFFSNVCYLASRTIREARLHYTPHVHSASLRPESGGGDKQLA